MSMISNIKRLEPTYKELKPLLEITVKFPSLGLEPTYKELKQNPKQNNQKK
ncbi:MAG: hypothetical protein CH6_1023 [Candidatus Kapaibacterium sp.]|nr:MAG: hypothetical protein CH6_1023 [Candidatus Kapabacteria bacterium]